VEEHYFELIDLFGANECEDVVLVPRAVLAFPRGNHSEILLSWGNRHLQFPCNPYVANTLDCRAYRWAARLELLLQVRWLSVLVLQRAPAVGLSQRCTVELFCLSVSSSLELGESPTHMQSALLLITRY
jgi:hypothetical protein